MEKEESLPLEAPFSWASSGIILRREWEKNDSQLDVSVIVRDTCGREEYRDE